MILQPISVNGGGTPSGTDEALTVYEFNSSSEEINNIVAKGLLLKQLTGPTLLYAGASTGNHRFVGFSDMEDPAALTVTEVDSDGNYETEYYILPLMDSGNTYAKIGDLLLCWGTLTANGSVTFPIKYRVAPAVVTGTSRTSTGVISNVTTTGFTASSVVSTGFWWLSIGNAS